MKPEIKFMIDLYHGLTKTIFEIQSNRLSVAKNDLGSMAAKIKLLLRKAGIEVDVTTRLDPFTIVGYYEDESQIFTEYVMAVNSNDAVKRLVDKIEKDKKAADNGIKKAIRDNIVIVSIFRGQLEDLNDCSQLSNACDWPGLSL